MQPDRFIGVDVGGTKILGLVVDPNTGRVDQRIKRPTPRHDPGAEQEPVASAIGDVVSELLDQTPSVTAIGVGVPGLVDHRGVLHYGPNVPGVVGLDAAGYLRERFGLPTTANNDATCAALAEHRLGAARGSSDVVVVTQGTGIGGGLIVGGRLVRGFHGFAGEPGHMLTRESGFPCACGQIGCWEAVASGTGLANLARQRLALGRGGHLLDRCGGDPSKLRGEHVSGAAAEGDPDALAIVEEFAGWVARGLGSLVTLLDPELIVLGGGLTVISQQFLADVQERLASYVLGGSARPPVPVVPAQLGAEAGAIGAAIDAHDLFRR